MTGVEWGLSNCGLVAKRRVKSVDASSSVTGMTDV